MPGASYSGPLPGLSAEQVALRDALRRDLTVLAADIGERNVRHLKELGRAQAWIESEFASAGLESRRQSYEVEGVTCANVEVEARGSRAPEEIVVLGAHYDSARGTAGANDNGTGAVALLALARMLAHRHFDRTVRFVEFVNEEPPYFLTARMGSDVYAQRSRSRGENIVAMISLETMGCFSDEAESQDYPFPMNLLYPNRGNFIAFVGNVESGALVRSAVGAFRRTTAFPSEGAALPEHTTGIGWSDHASFWKAGYPALMVTDTALFRYHHYHHATDTLDKVDFDRLARVVAGLGRAIEALATR
jgi:Zn-dependent M28 family amino/carboxypeptidase